MEDGIFSHILGLCLDCLTLGTSGFYLIYATVVLLAGLIVPRVGNLVSTTGEAPNTVGPADVGGFTIPTLNEGGVVGTSYVAVMNLFKPASYVLLASYFLRMIKWSLGMKNGRYDYWRIYKRLVVFYFLAIPLPAAFLPPVGYPQAQPDAHLLSAVVLLILLNALGDLISSRVTIRNFDKVIAAFSNMPPLPVEDHLKEGFRFECRIYLTSLLDLTLALIVLCGVLAFSSILFGVQIGEYKFGLDSTTVSAMIDRASRFPELIQEMYWFRDLDGSVAADSGIPGMFLYGITTFIPTIVMIASALVWTLTIPLRIVLQLPKSRIQRIFASELSVLAICIVVTGLLGVSVSGVYSRLITMWAT